MVKILTVEYRELRTGSGYNNTTIGAVAEVNADSDPQATLAELQVWVSKQFGHDSRRSELKEKIADLEWQHENAERRIALVNRKWDAYVAFMAKLGIERPEDIPDTLDNLPF